MFSSPPLQIPQSKQAGNIFIFVFQFISLLFGFVHSNGLYWRLNKVGMLCLVMLARHDKLIESCRPDPNY